MKHQYFGDVNDYRKYGVLRAVAVTTGLRLGICWLLTADDQRRHGEFRQYLQQPGRWRQYDADLYDRLGRLLLPGTARTTGSKCKARVSVGEAPASSCIGGS